MVLSSVNVVLQVDIILKGLLYTEVQLEQIVKDFLIGGKRGKRRKNKIDTHHLNIYDKGNLQNFMFS